MKRKSVVFFILILLIANYAFSMNFKSLYVFGDSLSVRGVEGKNWQIWPEYLKNQIIVSSDNYRNLAFPGARSNEILMKVDAYLAANSIDPDGLYAVFGGINDLRSNSKYILESVRNLHSNGANFILVSNLHDNPRRSTAFIKDYNKNFLNDFNNLEANIIQIDTYSLLEEMYDNPALFGFSNVTDIVFDNLHFSSEVHEILSDYMAGVINASSVVTILPEIILGEVRANDENLSLFLNRLRGEIIKGELTPFLNYKSGSLDIVDSEYSQSAIGDIKGFSLGLSYNFIDNFSVGILLDFGNLEGDFGKSAGDYELGTSCFSLFARYNYKRVYFDIVYSSGEFSFDKIERKVVLGNVTRYQSGTTDGDNGGFGLKFSGALYRKNNFSMNPFLSYKVNSISLDGYTENGDFATCMNFGSQERDSAILSFGVRFDYSVSTSFGKLLFFSEIESEKDSKDSQRSLDLGVKTLPGSYFEMPGYTPGSNSLKYNAGCVIELNKGWSGSISFSKREGDEASEDYFFIGFSKLFNIDKKDDLVE